jgi:arylformamidase
VDPVGATDLVAHRVLLAAGVVILEGLDLEAVAPGAYELLCLPLRLVNGDGAPARVLLRRAGAA